MPIHTISIPDHAAAVLRGISTDKAIHLLTLESAILEHFTVRWESATPHERQKMIDSLRITLGGN